MAHEPENRETARSAQAKKEVRFDQNALSRQAPKDTKANARTALYTRSKRRSSLPSFDTYNASETVGRDSDDNDGHDAQDNPTITVDEYKVMIAKAVAESRFNLTVTEMADDLQKKLEHLVEIYGRREGPEFPFKAMTPFGKTHITFDGLVTEEKFKQLLQEQPAAMFQEVKMRVLLMHAYMKQTAQLYTTAIRMSQEMTCLNNWVTLLVDRQGIPPLATRIPDAPLMQSKEAFMMADEDPLGVINHLTQKVEDFRRKLKASKTRSLPRTSTSRP